MRLGDLDALKEVIEASHYLLSSKYNSTDYGMFTTGIIEAIDNAPTVDAICPYFSDNEVKQLCLSSPCERTQNRDNYDLGYVQGLEEGRNEKRTQGEWIDHGNNIECNQCRVWFLKDHLIRKSFCPNCGSKNVR